MAYGELKVDSITFTNGGTDTTVSVSGLVQNPTFSGDITVTGTISGDVVQGGTLVSGATVSGTAGEFGTVTGNTAGFTTVTGTTVTGTTSNFVSGVFTTQISGATITGNAGQFSTITGNTVGFTTVTGATVTGTTANFVTVSGTNITGETGQFTSITGGTAGFTTVTGTTVTGTTANFATLSGTTVTGGTGQFTSLTSTTATITSGVFVSGTAAAPSISVGTTDNGIYSPGTDQVAISTSGTERLRITSDGQVRLAGAGITFNGDTATANELDDYEEGTWTPEFSFATPGDLSVSYSNQVGNYRIVGKLCIATFILEFTPTYTTSSGTARVSGLPLNQGTFLTVPASVNRFSGFAIVDGFDNLWLRKNTYNDYVEVYQYGRSGSTTITTTQATSGSVKILNGTIIFNLT